MQQWERGGGNLNNLALCSWPIIATKIINVKHN